MGLTEGEAAFFAASIGVALVGAAVALYCVAILIRDHLRRRADRW